MTTAAHELVDLELPGRGGTASFSEPWQAEALAITVQLSRRGIFTWIEWVKVFSAEIARNPQGPEEDIDTAYYRQWLSALETILGERGVTHASEIADTQEHWRRSYLNTPHGHPIEFSREWEYVPDGVISEHHHHHHAHQHRSPAAVDPGQRDAKI